MSRLASILYGTVLPFFLFIYVSRPTEPCEEAKNAGSVLSGLARTNIFEQAKRELIQAGEDGKEHSLVFGRNAVGDNIVSAIKSMGSEHASAVEPDFPGAFADMHNHPANSVPSTGDIYNLIRINGKNPLHSSRLTVLANGTVYAVSIYNYEQAAAFIGNYPPEQAKGFSPGFPERLFNEFAELKSYLINIQRIGKTTADEMATAYILDKYQSGVALFRLLQDDTFARVYITKETNGNSMYQLNFCK